MSEQFENEVQQATAIAERVAAQKATLFVDVEKVNHSFGTAYIEKTPIYADHQARLDAIEQAALAEMDVLLVQLESRDEVLTSEIARMSEFDAFGSMSAADTALAASLRAFVKEDCYELSGDELAAKIRACYVAGDTVRLALYRRYVERATNDRRLVFTMAMTEALDLLEQVVNPNAGKILAAQEERYASFQAQTAIRAKRNPLDARAKTRTWQPR